LYFLFFTTLGIIGLSKIIQINDYIQYQVKSITYNTLTKSEEKIYVSKILHSIPVPALICYQNEMTILMANEYFYNAFNTKQKLIQGKTIEKIGIIIDKSNFEKILNDNLPLQTEIEYPSEKDKHYFLCNVISIYNNSKYVLFTFNDITKIKKLYFESERMKEEAILSDKLKTQLLASVNHDIRSSLNGIIGFSSLLSLENLEKDKMIQYTGIIQYNSEHLMNIINDIIDFAKAKTGQLKTNISVENLNMMMNDLYVRFENEIKNIRKNIRLIRNTGLEDEECFFYVDRFRINQIFINFFLFHLKHTEEGTIEFGYNTNKENIEFYIKSDDYVLSDTERKIFEKNYDYIIQTEKHISKIILGIMLNHSIIELFDGQYVIKSSSEEGTSFTFKIPSQIIDNTIIYPEKSVKAIDSLNILSGKNILIVEDLEYNRLLFNEYLNDTGANLFFAINGNEAIEISKKTKIDIILLDIQLPDINGYELIKEIKKIQPDAILIAQTAYALSGERKKALEAGFNQYISKPIKQDVLLTALTKVVENHLN